MRRTVLVVLALSIALLLLVKVFGGQRKAIAQAQAAASHFRLQRDSLVTAVNDRERQKAAFERERVMLVAEANRLRDSIPALERRRAKEQLTVRTIRTTGALQDRLRGAFPELGSTAWGLSTLPFEDGDTLGLEYLLVPAWFAETFIIDHANSASWRAQKDVLLGVDSLRLAIGALQDSVTRLVAANAAAYEAGYQTAYANYQDLSRRYVAELSKPRIKLPSIVAIVGAAGIGVVIGRTIP